MKKSFTAKKGSKIFWKSMIAGLLLGCLTLGAWAAFAAPAEPTAVPAAPAPAPQPEKNPERVLAKVEGFEIKEKDVDQLLQMTGPQGAMMYDNEQGRKALLDELIAARLFSLSAVKQGLDQTPEFKAAVDGFVTQARARAAIEKSIQGVDATEEEAKKFYDDNPDQFTSPEQIRASHILVSNDVTSADTIKVIQDELKKGTSFDVLATQYSTDPGAAQGGGDLGLFGRGQMVPEFETAAFALAEPGDISDPVQSPFGWHIIKLEEKKPASTIAYDEMKAQILQYLTGEKRSKKYQEDLEVLKKEYKIEMLDAAPGAQ